MHQTKMLTFSFSPLSQIIPFQYSFCCPHHQHRHENFRASTFIPTTSISRATTCPRRHIRTRTRTSSSTTIISSSSSRKNNQFKNDPSHSPESYGFLHIATVTSAHGVRGAVKVVSVSDFPSFRLSPTCEQQRYLKLSHRRYPRPISIKSSSSSNTNKKTWILNIEGVNTRDDFELMKLQHAKLYIRHQVNQGPPGLSRGEYVSADLISLKVLLKIENNNDVYYEAKRAKGKSCIYASHPIGLVEGVIHSRDVCKDENIAKLMNDTLQIVLFDQSSENNHEMDEEIQEHSKRILVPFVKEIVPVVDLSKSIVVIDPPPGLLDIAIVNDVTKPRAPRGLLMPSSDTGVTPSSSS